jgi:anti-sigma factor RsiW
MSNEKLLKIMAHVDGELTGSRCVEVDDLLAGDTAAAALHGELAATRELLRTHEPAGSVPDSREFYWSQIRRRIEEQERGFAREGSSWTSAFRWLRWLAPALGVAAVALIVALQQRSGSAIVAGLDSRGDSIGEATSMTFTSESDGVTIRWIN